MRQFRRLAAFVLSGTISAAALAQELVKHDRPVRVRHLAGRVFDRSGASIAYPAVELRDAADHHVIASTFADANGRFFFADRKRGETFEIRVSLAGFHTVEYIVVQYPLGKAQLRVALPVAA